MPGRERTPKQKTIKEQVVLQLGEELGSALYTYLWEKSSDVKVRVTQRNAFSKSLINRFENGTPREKVSAVSALLFSIEHEDRIIKNAAALANEFASMHTPMI